MTNLYLTIYTIFVKSFTYKKGSLAILSLPVSYTIEQFIENESFFGISLGLCMVLMILIIIDFITGIIASKVDKQKIKSHLLANTIYKCMMIFLFFWFLHEIKLQLVVNIDIENPKPVSDFVYNNATPFISFLRTFIFILITFREWVSIGENSERILGHKLYLFSLIEKVTEVIERKFINRIENFDGSGGNKNTNTEDNQEENRRDLL